MRKLSILVMAMVLVVGMSFGVMAEDGADAEVEQIGNNNTVEAYQSVKNKEDDPNDPNFVDVIQDGTLNEVFINQGNRSGTEVSQIGYDNFVDVEAGFNQYTEIDQDGNYNDATVEASIMGDGAWVGSTDYKGTQLVQEGNNNEFSAQVYISQSFSKQIGDSNYIDLIQTSNQKQAEAFMNQEGNRNHIELTQSDSEEFSFGDYGPGDHDSAFILQRGDNNVARLEQSGMSEFASEDIVTGQFYKQESTSTFAQLGDGNRLAGVNKSGDSLVLIPSEAAEQNSSIFNGYQDGNDNVIGLYQGGDDDGLITQDGDSNEALLYQGDELSHTSDIIQNGNDNDAEVIQTSN